MSKTHASFEFDLKRVRDEARRNLDQGSVTPDYPANRQTVLKLLNDSLATELVCVLRYKRHHFMAKGIESESVAAEFLQHANEEQQHADMLAARIVQLGGEPDFSPATLVGRSHSEYKEGADLKDMIRENLIAERIAIESYRAIINYLGHDDTTTRRIFEQILATEEEHADDMTDLLYAHK